MHTVFYIPLRLNARAITWKYPSSKRQQTSQHVNANVFVHECAHTHTHTGTFITRVFYLFPINLFLCSMFLLCRNQRAKNKTIYLVAFFHFNCGSWFGWEMRNKAKNSFFIIFFFLLCFVSQFVQLRFWLAEPNLVAFFSCVLITEKSAEFDLIESEPFYFVYFQMISFSAIAQCEIFNILQKWNAIVSRHCTDILHALFFSF